MATARYRDRCRGVTGHGSRDRGRKTPASPEKGRPIPALEAGRVILALTDLDGASTHSEIDLPGYRLHPPKETQATLKRLGFRQLAHCVSLQGGDVRDVDLTDSH